MTGLIPQPFLDILLQQTDLVELIDGYIPLKKMGSSYVACCPFHPEKTPSFNVITKKQFYHCFGCGASGNAISFVMSYLNCGFVETIELLAQRVGLAVPRNGKSDNNKLSKDGYQLLKMVTQSYQKNLKNNAKAAIDYLRQRGLSGNIAKTFQLGFALDDWHFLEKTFRQHHQALIDTGMLVKTEEGKTYDRFRNRIMFPIHDKAGRIIAFGGRVLDPQQKPKYLNSPETLIFQKNKTLYGLYQVLQTQKQHHAIIVVEGYMDVIALVQHDIHNVVATLGTATSTHHMQLLAQHTQQLLFCFDGDHAGRQAAWRALENALPLLNTGLDVGFVFLPESHDPDSLVRQLGKEAFLEKIKSFTPLHYFLLETLQKDLNLNRPAGKTQLLRLAKPLLQKIGEGAYQQLLIQELARATHLDQDRINQLMSTPEKKISPPSSSQVRSHVIKRSPLRVAVALLLQHPELYLQIQDNIQPTTLHMRDHQVLIQLLTELSQKPNATTAMLIETWRNSEYFEAIMQMAAWDHQVPEVALIDELRDTLFLLQRQNQDEIIRQYIHKARLHGLDPTERIHLKALLQQRHTHSVAPQ